MDTCSTGQSIVSYCNLIPWKSKQQEHTTIVSQGSKIFLSLLFLSFIADFIVKFHLLQLDKKVHKYRITMFIPSSLQYFYIVLTNYWSIKYLCNFLSIVLLFFFTFTYILYWCITQLSFIDIMFVNSYSQANI